MQISHVITRVHTIYTKDVWIRSLCRKNQQKEQDRARILATGELDVSIQFVFQNGKETLYF